MNKNQSKRRRDIKSKLIAAICMLLVSSIMMVTSTYAWFTLSTAPEVTGISTAVGANGNLEMALLPKTGLLTDIKSEAGDSTKDIEAKNVTWGNLVDVSDTTVYGLDKITLFPSALNLTADGKVDVKGFVLKTPTYGADGRVDTLVPNAQTGYFDKQTKSFSPNNEYGIRAVGTASGMTDRQLDYRNARSAANTAKAMAANLASQSLNNNGSALANIAIEYGMGADTAKFNQTDVASLRAIVDDLQDDGGVLDQIETAYIQYILAYSASKLSGEADTAWQAVSGLVEAENATLSSVLTGLGSIEEMPALPPELTTAIAEYNETVAAVAQADTDLQALEDDGADAEFTWAQIRIPMEPLANPASMTINGFPAGEVKDKLGDLVSSVTAQGGLKVIMGTGAGVYADVADQSGDYTASITIEKVEYNGIVLNNMNARMETASTVKPPYLERIGGVIETAGAPESTGGAVLPISDMYGYIVDLAFRTNAAESNLLLQQDAVDRIYGNNTNEQTMGHGATMTFMATTTSFSNNQVKGLMDAITMVFFDPTNGTIYCYGGLDTAAATAGTDGVTAEIYLYKITGNETTYRPAQTGETATHVGVPKTEYVETTEGATHVWNDSTSSYVAAGDGVTATHKEVTTTTYREATDDETATHVAVAGTPTKTKIDDNKIMALTQNQAQAVSVLVYLDGNLVGNDDVAATAAASMTGKMNLQFASSATLVPMEYADLHIPGQTATSYKVTTNLPSGWTSTGAATTDGKADYTFKLNNGTNDVTDFTGYTVTYTVGTGAAQTITPAADGTCVIAQANINGDIAITVAATTP